MLPLVTLVIEAADTILLLIMVDHIPKDQVTAIVIQDLEAVIIQEVTTVAEAIDLHHPRQDLIHQVTEVVLLE